jgi:spermidine/putrescine transport system substrate-binding protein
MKPFNMMLSVSAFAIAATAVTAQDSELTIFTWSGFEEDGYWQGYAAEFGDAPTFTFFGAEDEAFQKLRSGFRADVAHPCPQSVSKWLEAGLIEPWDISKIPNYALVPEFYKTAPILTEGDDVYFIPGDSGATAIAYNTDEITEEQVSTLAVFLDPALAGRISLPDNVDDVYALALLATGVDDWTTATMDDVAAASAWLRDAHQNVRTYWTDGAELGQLMATGEVLVAWSWNETPVNMREEGIPIAFNRTPAEGTSVWTCGFVNLVDGPGSEDKAHAWMNQWLSPEVTNYIVREWGYGHSNTVAMEDIGEELLTEVGLQEVTTVPLLPQLPLSNEIRETMISEFEKIKAGF